MQYLSWVGGAYLTCVLNQFDNVVLRMRYRVVTSKIYNVVVDNSVY